MKKLLALMLAALLVLCAGCGGDADVDNNIDGTKFGYINGWSESEGQYTISFDEAEWLTATEDADRLRELDLDPDNLDDGYYINNPEEEDQYLQLADDVKITVLSFMDWSEEAVDAAGFAEYFDANLLDLNMMGVSMPFWVTVEGGKVIDITMQYIP